MGYIKAYFQTLRKFATVFGILNLVVLTAGGNWFSTYLTIVCLIASFAGPIAYGIEEVKNGNNR